MGLPHYYQSNRVQTTANATILPVSAVSRQRHHSLSLCTLRPTFVGRTEAGARRRRPGANGTRSMRAVVQRVLSASVEVEGRVVSEIGPGLLVLVGIHESDKEADADYICRKVLNMRLFPNINTGKAWDQSVMQRNFEVLLVSEFTLYGVLKGNKPDFHVAMPPQKANLFYSSVVNRFCKSYNSDLVKDGIFGTMMKVNLVNDGPVTMQIESPSRHHEQSVDAGASETAELQQ